MGSVTQNSRKEGELKQSEGKKSWGGRGKKKKLDYLTAAIAQVFCVWASLFPLHLQEKKSKWCVPSQTLSLNPMGHLFEALQGNPSLLSKKSKQLQTHIFCLHLKLPSIQSPLHLDQQTGGAKLRLLFTLPLTSYGRIFCWTIH